MTDLYRFFDRAGRLLYVGVSLNAAFRASQHKADGTCEMAGFPDPEPFLFDGTDVEAIRRLAAFFGAPVPRVEGII